jgi:hypothetical protein
MTFWTEWLVMCGDAYGDVCRDGAEPDELVVVVQEGDIVVAATDGVLDNLFDYDIAQVVARSDGYFCTRVILGSPCSCISSFVLFVIV